MSKEQLVADAQVALASAQAGVLGDLVDKAQAEVAPVEGGGPSEAEIQARIDAGKLEQKALDDQAMADALAAIQVSDQAQIEGLNGIISGLNEQMAAKDAEHAALVAKEGVESAQLDSIKASKAQLQAVVDFLSALLAPAPSPEPEVPVEPQP